MEYLLLRHDCRFCNGIESAISRCCAPDLAGFLLVVLVPDLAITAKRWHDRDKSSWWLLLNVPLVIGRMTIPAGELAVNTQPGMLETLISFVALLCGAWILVECGFLSGTDGSNRLAPSEVDQKS